MAYIQERGIGGRPTIVIEADEMGVDENIPPEKRATQADYDHLRQWEANRDRQRKLDQLKKWREMSDSDLLKATRKAEMRLINPGNGGESDDDRARQEEIQRRGNERRAMRDRAEQQGADRPGQKLFNATEQEALRKLPSGGEEIVNDIKKAGLAEPSRAEKLNAMVNDRAMGTKGKSLNQYPWK